MREEKRPDETIEPLRFPVPPEPLLDPPPATIDMILAASEEMLPVWNADPHREEKRLAMKCHERFVLRE